MKQQLLIICIVLLYACKPTSSNKINASKQTSKVDTTSVLKTSVSGETLEQTTETASDYAAYYIVIADTGQDYFVLRKKMFGLNSKLNLPIDTMGRLFNAGKNLIALPENDEDELYAGEYFPRRFPSINLSLEYLNFYQKEAGQKTIALVTGIYETNQQADNACKVLRKTEKKAFKIKAEIYVGCMH